MKDDNKCPRCHEAQLKSWSELDVDERQIVPRLPNPVKYPLAERQQTHSWCTRCWHEQTEQVSHA